MRVSEVVVEDWSDPVKVRADRDRKGQVFFSIRQPSHGSRIDIGDGNGVSDLINALEHIRDHQ